MRDWYNPGQEDVHLAMSALSKFENLLDYTVHGVEVGNFAPMNRHGSTTIEFKPTLSHSGENWLVYRNVYQDKRITTIYETYMSIHELPKTWKGVISLRNVHFLSHPTAKWDEKWRRTSKLENGALAFLDELVAMAPEKEKTPIKLQIEELQRDGRLVFATTDLACRCCDKRSGQNSESHSSLEQYPGLCRWLK